MDGIATKCDFTKYHCEGWPWHFKNNEDIITKFKWHKFQITRINRKKFDGSGTTPSYFPALMNLAILGHFSQSQGIKMTKTLLFILKFLWCSNNLMQKNDFYNPLYLLNYLFESIFEKFWPEILIIMKDLDNPTQW